MVYAYNISLWYLKLSNILLKCGSHSPRACNLLLEHCLHRLADAGLIKVDSKDIGIGKDGL